MATGRGSPKGQVTMSPKANRDGELPEPGRMWRLARLVVLVLPSAVLAGAALRADGDAATVLWLGAAVLLAGCLLALVWGPGWRGSADLAIIVLYVAGIGWLVAVANWPEDWYCHVAQAVMLVVPLG